MKTRGLIVAAAALAVAAALAGPVLADDLDALTPMNSDGLGGVKGTVAAGDDVDPALRAAGSGTTPAVSSFDAASTLSGNEANNVSLGVISLNNNVENSALSLSGSLLTNNAGAGTP